MKVSIITDSEDNRWIQAFKKEGKFDLTIKYRLMVLILIQTGGHIYIPACPLSSRKTRSVLHGCMGYLAPHKCDYYGQTVFTEITYLIVH